jgi:hypothetical protein
MSPEISPSLPLILRLPTYLHTKKREIKPHCSCLGNSESHQPPTTNTNNTTITSSSLTSVQREPTYLSCPTRYKLTYRSDLTNPNQHQLPRGSHPPRLRAREPVPAFVRRAPPKT